MVDSGAMERCRLAFRLAISALLMAGCASTSPSREPAGGSADAVASGAREYERLCSSCHGLGAEGDGPLAKLLKVPTPDLTRLAARAGGDFPAAGVRRTVDGTDDIPAHGARTMPVWGRLLDPTDGRTPEGRASADRQIDALVAYLGSIQRAI